MLGKREEDWADYGMMAGGPVVVFVLCTIVLGWITGWEVVAEMLGAITLLLLIAAGATVAGRQIGRILGRTMDKRARRSEASLMTARRKP